MRREVNTSFNSLHERLEDERKLLLEELNGPNSVVMERKQRTRYAEKEDLAAYGNNVREGIIFRSHLLERLKEVDKALHKFSEGKYGLCENCGKPIEFARLDALPQASLCLNCKAQQEKSLMLDKSYY